MSQPLASAAFNQGNLSVYDDLVKLDVDTRFQSQWGTELNLPIADLVKIDSKYARLTLTFQGGNFQHGPFRLPLEFSNSQAVEANYLVSVLKEKCKPNAQILVEPQKRSSKILTYGGGCLGIFFVFSIIGGILSPKPQSPTPIVTQGNSTPMPAPTPAPLLADPEPVEDGRSQKLRAYLNDFSDVDWYAVYKGASIEGDTAHMTLDLPRNAMFRPSVENACGALSGYINSNDNKSQNLSRIEIKNTENQPLAWTGLDGSCSTFSGG